LCRLCAFRVLYPAVEPCNRYNPNFFAGPEDSALESTRERSREVAAPGWSAKSRLDDPGTLGKMDA
jgi:hypothetical protein